jgi:hypothetical protein
MFNHLKLININLLSRTDFNKQNENNLQRGAFNKTLIEALNEFLSNINDVLANRRLNF